MKRLVLDHGGRWVLILAVSVALLAEARRAESTETAEISAAHARMMADVMYLADDEREGRAPGSEGIEQAADYIAEAFQHAGLKPAPDLDGYFQTFTIPGDVAVVGEPSLTVRLSEDECVSAEPSADFTPLAIGSSGTVEGLPVVFAGYGIVAEDKSIGLDYNDYKNIDVKDKVVLIIRREPQRDKDDGPFRGRRDSPYAYFSHKIPNAFRHGAAAVLMVNDGFTLKDNDEEDELLDFQGAGPIPFSRIPVMMITRALADRMLASAGQPLLEELEAQIDADLTPRSRELDGVTIDATVEIDRATITTKNVVGVLEGVGPLAEETIVVGGHYDHLGYGGRGSLSFGSREIHNGADDNASGTAMVMEMARRLAQRSDPLPRRVVFIAFSAEERGLLGSAHYVDNPPYPLDQTVMMVNFDMVGRLNDKDELTVYGTGTSPGMEAIVEALGEAAGFAIRKIASGAGPSDQASFYRKDIPVLFFFTGSHRDYHRPSDVADRINYEGMARVADFAELLLLDVARRPQRPEFTRAAARSRRAPQAPDHDHGDPHGEGEDPGRLAVRAYLGTIPDYDEGTEGVRINDVREGSPAEQGGLKAGDVVVGFDGQPVSTIYDYTEHLGRHKPGDTVEIVVMRDGEKVTLEVTLGTRPPE